MKDIFTITSFATKYILFRNQRVTVFPDKFCLFIHHVIHILMRCFVLITPHKIIRKPHAAISRLHLFAFLLCKVTTRKGDTAKTRNEIILRFRFRIFEFPRCKTKKAKRAKTKWNHLASLKWYNLIQVPVHKFKILQNSNGENTKPIKKQQN